MEMREKYWLQAELFVSLDALRNWLQVPVTLERWTITYEAMEEKATLRARRGSGSGKKPIEAAFSWSASGTHLRLASLIPPRGDYRLVSKAESDGLLRELQSVLSGPIEALGGTLVLVDPTPVLRNLMPADAFESLDQHIREHSGYQDHGSMDDYWHPWLKMHASKIKSSPEDFAFALRSHALSLESATRWEEDRCMRYARELDFARSVLNAPPLRA